jgi:hypothetical protein
MFPSALRCDEHSADTIAFDTIAAKAPYKLLCLAPSDTCICLAAKCFDWSLWCDASVSSGLLPSNAQTNIFCIAKTISPLRFSVSLISAVEIHSSYSSWEKRAHCFQFWQHIQKEVIFTTVLSYGTTVPYD